MESSMLKTLKCTNCLEVLSSPIYQCSNGHIFCSNCLKKVVLCGVCAEMLWSGNPIRSLMAEKLAETIAKLQISKFGENKSSLIVYCNLLGLMDVFGCGERIPRDQIISHVKQHGLNANGVNGNNADVIQELEDFTNPQSWLPVYFEAYDETFFLLSSTKNDLNYESSLLISWRCVMVGDPMAAKNYCLQLCLRNDDKDSKITFDCPVIGIENRANSADPQFFLPLSQLKQFGQCNGEKKLEWTINVQIGKKSESANGFQTLDDTVVPKVKTCSFAPQTIAKHSSSLLRINGNLNSGNKKVFLDLMYDNEFIGRLVIELRNDIVPLTAENFRCLCTGEKGFGYKGTCLFNIFVKNYIMGGDVTKDDGTGGKSIYGDTFERENFSLKHNERGILSMANNEKEASNIGSIFMIALREQSHLDGHLVVFGKVVEGMKVLDELEKLILIFNKRYAIDKKTIIQNCGQL